MPRQPPRTRTRTRTPITFSKGCGTQTTGQCLVQRKVLCAFVIFLLAVFLVAKGFRDEEPKGCGFHVVLAGFSLGCSRVRTCCLCLAGDAVALCFFSRGSCLGSHDCLHLGSRYSVASLAIRLCFISSRVLFASCVSNATFLCLLSDDILSSRMACT